MNVETASFEREVLEASSTIPVIVDFWAPWCAPCRALGPVLEKLEREYAGRFKLAKVNSDENQELAAALNVRSIPYVLAFRNRKAVAQFVGALPESQVRAFIEKVLPSVHEKNVDKAEALIAENRLDEAERLLDSVPSHIDWDARVETLRAAIGFARSGGSEPDLRSRIARNAEDLEARFALARLLAGRHRYGEAMEELLAIVRKDKDWKDGEARRQLLHLFTLAADEPDTVSEYRRKLATALY
jgi:putative thioredoxin